MSNNVQFEVQGKPIGAPRAVIEEASPVFASLLKKSRNNSCKSIQIDDIKPEIFRPILVFLLQKQVPDFDPDNVLEYLQSAYKYELRDLQVDSLRYIEDHRQPVVTSRQWTSFFHSSDYELFYTVTKQLVGTNCGH